MLPEGSVIINLPGDYSGDLCHIALAALMTKNVYIVMTISEKEKNNSKAIGCFRRAQLLFTKLKLSDRFQLIPLPEASLSAAYEAPFSGHNQRDANIALGHQLALTKKLCAMGYNIEIKPVFASTNCILDAQKKLYPDPKDQKLFHSKLAKKLTKGFNPNKKTLYWLYKYTKYLQGLGPFIVLNMRNASYHPFDNTTKGRIKTLQLAINDNAEAFKIKPIILCIGDCSKLRDWLRENKMHHIELYGVDRDAGGWDDLQRIAFFWSKVAQMKNCLGITGGRSGSLDTAVFMGVKPALCWTKFDIEEAAYQRVFAMSSMMSLCNINMTEAHSYIFNDFVKQFTMAPYPESRDDINWPLYQAFTRHLILCAENKFGATFAPNVCGYGGIYLEKDKISIDTHYPEKTAFKDTLSSSESEGGESDDEKEKYVKKEGLFNLDIEKEI